MWGVTYYATKVEVPKGCGIMRFYAGLVEMGEFNNPIKGLMKIE